MNLNGDILIIEDDEDDRFILDLIFKELNYTNPVIFFENPIGAYEYLIKPETKPFIIIADINMPTLTGLELRDLIYSNESLKHKCAPFIFLTTSTTSEDLFKAYQMSIQGFFIKKAEYEDQKEMLKKIIDYWKESLTP